MTIHLINCKNLHLENLDTGKDVFIFNLDNAVVKGKDIK
jgi:hypothetical protein